MNKTMNENINEAKVIISNIYNYATNDEISNKYISKLFKICGEIRQASYETEENENSNKHKEID